MKARAATLVVHCKRDRNAGTHDHDDYIYIGRPSRWGNPFVIGKDGNRDEVIAKYREWIKTQFDLLHGIPKLRGKRLGCWCAPNACHGDVLAEFANRPICGESLSLTMPITQCVQFKGHEDFGLPPVRGSES